MKWITPSFLIILIFALGGIWFKSSAPQICGALSADANIFVLTGDVRRIPFATKFLTDFPNRRLYIIGVGTHNFADYMPDEVRRQIETENESKSTFENAAAIREIVRERDIRRLVLVTTEDHMTRAELLLRRQLPDVKITPCPVPLRGMHAPRRLERWTMEYIKYIGTLVGMERKK